MKKDGTEVFEVTLAQLESWERNNPQRFAYELDPDTDLLSVQASRDGSGWLIVAHGDGDAERCHEDYEEWGLERAADGLTDEVEHEVWRVVDMPVSGKCYLVDACTLRAIDHIAKRLERAVRAAAHLGDLEELVTGELRIAKKFSGIFLTDEQFELLSDSVSLRNETHRIAMSPAW